MLLPYYCRLTLSSIVWVLNFQRDIFHLLNMIQHVTEMSLAYETLFYSIGHSSTWLHEIVDIYCFILVLC